MTWDEFWNTISNFFASNWTNIFHAILVIVLGFILTKIVLKLIKKLLKRSKIAPITQTFINSIVKALIYTIYILAILQAIGVPLTGLTTVLATAGVAISLALKDSLSNIAYGMILISTKPFSQGDYVEIGGDEGTVKEIGIMTSTIITTDNKQVTIPNSIIYSSAIVNYSARGSRRIEMYFDVSYDSDLEKVKDIILKVCNSNGKILLDPAPEVNLKYFKDDNLSLYLTCWTKGPYWEIYFYIMDNVYNEFKRNNININYRQLEVRMKTDEKPLPYRKAPLPKRVEPKEVETKEFSIFDIDSFKELQQTAKKKRKERLEKKKKKIEKELSALKESQPQNHKNTLIISKSVLIKKKIRVTKMIKKTKFKQK